MPKYKLDELDRKLIFAFGLGCVFYYFTVGPGPDNYIKERKISVQTIDLNNDKRKDLVVTENFYRLHAQIYPDFFPKFFPLETRTIFLQDSLGKYVLLEDTMKNMKFKSAKDAQNYKSSIDSIAEMGEMK